MFKNLVCGLAASFVVASVISSRAAAARAYEVDAGIDVLSHALGKTSSSETGATSFMGPIFINLDFQAHVPIGDGLIGVPLSVSPRVIWAPSFLLPHKDSGSPVKTTFLIVDLPLVYDFNDSFDFSAGPAYVVYTIAGPGGTTQLNNGNSTSTFALPGDSVSAKTIALMIGTSYKTSDFRFSLDLMSEGFLSSKKRTFSLMGAIAYAVF